MAINYDELFGKIKTSMNRENELNKDVLNLEIGSVVTGRLLPDIKNPDNTILKYHWHIFDSRSVIGKKISFLCPTQYGEKCPFCSKSIEYWKSGDATQKELSKSIRRKENWLANFYVINDNKHPENNGTVKKLKYGYQINTTINNAIEEDAFGRRIFMLDETGCNFKIKCEKNSAAKDAWPSYSSSTFMPPSKIEGMTPEREEQILNSTFKLEPSYKKYTYKELVDMLNEHFLINRSSDVRTYETEERSTHREVDPDSIPDNIPGLEPAKKVDESSSKTPDVTDANIEDWLKDVG